MNYKRSEAKQAAREQFRGVWAAITTPFTPDGEVDYDGLRSNMRYYTDELAIDGIFCTGTMGEYWALTKEERKRIVEVVVEEARGKCMTIPHTGHHSAEETIDLTRHAQDVGADFAIVINPYFPAAKANDAMLYEWFKRVANAVDIGVWMFDTRYSGTSLSVELTGRIAELETICGIKCSRPTEHYAAVKRLCGDKIVMSHPSETHLLPLMRDHGQRVHMSSATPYLFQTAESRPMRDYVELALAGKFDEAKKIADAMEPMRVALERWVNGPWDTQQIIGIAAIKAWSEMLGMAGGPVRAPLIDMTADEKQAMRVDLEKAGLLKPEKAGAASKKRAAA
jgi:4-hydroxy-tetrahydrodipicolinate synthase